MLLDMAPFAWKRMIFFSKTLNPNKQLVLNVYPYYSTTLLYFSSLKQCSPEKIIIKNFFFQLIMRLNFIYSPFHLLHHHQQIMINPFSVLALILSSFCFVSIQTQPKKTTAQKPDSHYCHCTLFSYLPPSSLCPAKNIFWEVHDMLLATVAHFFLSSKWWSARNIINYISIEIKLH